MTIQQLYTMGQFEAFIQKPENADKLFEYIGGEIVEVPSNPYVSKLAMLIGAMLLTFVQDKKLGHITGEAGGYIVSGERYAPDVAFISYEKQAELAREGYNPNPPDLAVEILSSNRNDERDQLRIKITNYLAVDTIVWVVNPNEKLLEVHVSGKAVLIYRENDILEGQAALLGLKIKVADIFQN
jgi:Uma2 family endonuclease